MKRLENRIAAFAFVSMILLIGCATPEGLKPTQAWDQAAVTELAGELATRVASASADANTTTVDVDQIAPVNNYLNNLRILERQSRELHGDLQAGKGYSETLWRYGEVKHTYHAIYNTPSWRAIEADLETTQLSVASIVSQLEGYYGK